MPEQLVIVGAGQAAAQTIQSARQLGYAGTITLIGAEPYPPYQRPPLSKKYLTGDLPRDRLAFRPDDWYAKHDVQLKLGTPVEAVDRGARRLRLADGTAQAYDRLVLATGSRPRRLGVAGDELAGVHYLRTVDDVDAIAAELVPGRRLVVVGGGYIGLEVAAAARSRGLRVSIIEAAKRVLGRVVCDETAGFYTRMHETAGVAISCGAGVAAIEGNARVTAVTTTAGSRHACDLVVVGIGVAAADTLAAESGLACDDGILVDDCARTDDPAVLAAGDCTRHPHALVDGAVRLESVHNAVEQGKSAAHAVVGRPRPFTDVPWFWSDQYDVKLQIAGLAQRWDRIVIRGDPAARRFSAWYLDAGRLVAADAVNSPRDFIAAKKLIASGARPAPDRLADESAVLSAN